MRAWRQRRGLMIEHMIPKSKARPGTAAPRWKGKGAGSKASGIYIGIALQETFVQVTV